MRLSQLHKYSGINVTKNTWKILPLQLLSVVKILVIRNLGRIKRKISEAATSGLQVCNFITMRLQHRCFPLNIAKILKTPILKNIYIKSNYFWKFSNIRKHFTRGLYQISFFGSFILSTVIHSFTDFKVGNYVLDMWAKLCAVRSHWNRKKVQKRN